jgi:hypothetical protein
MIKAGTKGPKERGTEESRLSTKSWKLGAESCLSVPFSPTHLITHSLVHPFTCSLIPRRSNH